MPILRALAAGASNGAVPILAQVANLEIEGPDTGWVASVGFDEQGQPRVIETRDGWYGDIQHLVLRLLQEPSPNGSVPGEVRRPYDDDVLYELAMSLRRRRPLCRGERLIGYVAGGSRMLETADYAEQ